MTTIKRNTHFKFILITLLSVISILLCKPRDIKYTTKDSDFILNYYVNHITEGNNKTYPKIGDTVSIKFLARDPKPPNKIWFQFGKHPPLDVVLGARGPGPSNSNDCWDKIIPRISKGEKIYVVCKAEEVWGGRGNDHIPKDSDIGWELEIFKIKRLNKKKKEKKEVKEVKGEDKKDL